MRALVITAPGRAEVQEVPSPTPGPGEVVVDVDRAGICGTDIEIFHGEMAYLRSGHARFPMRIGHEWTGIVASVGAGTDRSEEHTSELQSRGHLVCRLLLEKKKQSPARPEPATRIPRTAAGTQPRAYAPATM